MNAMSPTSKDPMVTKTSDAGKPEYNVLDLVGVDGEVHLRHNNEIYKLRITRAGKLILTK